MRWFWRRRYLWDPTLFVIILILYGRRTISFDGFSPFLGKAMDRIQFFIIQFFWLKIGYQWFVLISCEFDIIVDFELDFLFGSKLEIILIVKFRKILMSQYLTYGKPLFGIKLEYGINQTDQLRVCWCAKNLSGRLLFDISTLLYKFLCVLALNWQSIGVVRFSCKL